jgi:hypothetical protein
MGEQRTARFERHTRFSSGTEVQQTTVPASGRVLSGAPFTGTDLETELDVIVKSTLGVYRSLCH